MDLSFLCFIHFEDVYSRVYSLHWKWADSSNNNVPYMSLLKFKQYNIYFIFVCPITKSYRINLLRIIIFKEQLSNIDSVCFWQNIIFLFFVVFHFMKCWTFSDTFVETAGWITFHQYTSSQKKNIFLYLLLIKNYHFYKSHIPILNFYLIPK